MWLCVLCVCGYVYISTAIDECCVVCVCVCVCVCVFVSVCVCDFVSVCVSVCVHLYAFCMCLYMCVLTCVFHSTIQRSGPFLYTIPWFVDRCWETHHLR